MKGQQGSSRSMTGANQATVRRNNRAVIYRSIWERGRVSRAELAQQTGLHAATITHIVEELLREGLVRETGTGESAIGRPPVYLEIEPGAAHVIGVILARNGVRAMLCDLRGRALEQCSFGGQYSAVEGDMALVRLMTAVEMLVGVARSSGLRVAGIGMGVPGPVDPRTGTVFRSPNWRIGDGTGPYPLGAMLMERFKLPVVVDNSGNASSLAERYFGIGRLYRNFLYISCGYGVGGGVILDGEIYRGYFGGAGEVGHITVDPSGPRCACGNVGCLELYASVPAILRRAAVVLQADVDDLTMAKVAAAYHAGHEGVQAVLNETALHMTTATVNAVNTLAPEAVVVGGLLGEVGPVLAARVEAEVRHRVFSVLSDHIRVLPPEAQDAPLLGSATLILREIVRTGATTLS